jgi:hypothetical protein
MNVRSNCTLSITTHALLGRVCDQVRFKIKFIGLPMLTLSVANDASKNAEFTCSILINVVDYM